MPEENFLIDVNLHEKIYIVVKKSDSHIIMEKYDMTNFLDSLIFR